MGSYPCGGFKYKPNSHRAEDYLAWCKEIIVKGKSMARLSILIVLFLTFLIFCSNAYPVDEADSLRGLRGVVVLIWDLPSEIGREGLLTKDQIQTDVELKLRTAGIRVLSLKEPTITGNPVFCVYVDVKYADIAGTGKSVGFAFNIHCSLRQNVYLERDPTIKNWATTWERGASGIGSKNFGIIRNEIKDEVDIFINDFLSVNPKGGK
jgi:hypothetical protein